MSAHVELSLPEYVLGVLPRDEHERVERHISTCPPCAAEAHAYREATSAIAGIAPEKPAPSYLRARLLASAEGNGRLARYAEDLAKLFEITTSRARALLDTVDTPDAWEQNPAGIGLIHLAPGPRYAAMGADAGLIRFPAGIEWPLHKHVGEEHHLFLQGAIRIHETGQVLRPGDFLSSPAGSQHSFVVLPEEDCVAAVLLTKGIEMPPGTPVSFD